MPYEESVGALGELLDEGKIHMAGISNADPEQIRLAQEVLGGRLCQRAEPVLAGLPQQRAGAAPVRPRWASPSCRGRPLGGISKAGELGSSFAPFQEVADAHGVSPQQVTLAWMLAPHRWSSRSRARRGPRPRATRPPRSSSS